MTFRTRDSNEPLCHDRATVRAVFGGARTPVFATALRNGIAFETQRGGMGSHVLVRHGPGRSLVAHQA